MARFAAMQVLAILPAACAWARLHERRIRRAGVPLSAAETAVARRVGVKGPELVRLLRVPEVPPMNGLFQRVGRSLGLVQTHTIGMTLGYGIYIREDHWREGRLVAHELAHVAQYERLGGFCGFLRVYLRECLEEGYPLGALEQEAKRAEGKS